MSSKNPIYNDETNDRLVYRWYDIDNDYTFYVGNGDLTRANKYKDSRNDLFMEYYNGHNCQMEILATGLTKSEANELEAKITQEYKNKGECHCNKFIGTHPTEDFKKWQSEVRKGIPVPQDKIFKQHSKETKDILRAQSIEYYSNKNNIEKARNVQKGRPIVQFDKEWNFVKQWGYIREAADKLNYDRNTIARCCKGEQKTYKDCRWVYLEEWLEELKYAFNKLDKETENKINTLIEQALIVKNENSKESLINEDAIVQLTLEGKYVRVWNFLRQIEKENTEGFGRKHIRGVCEGKSLTHKGYKWMYLSKYLETLKNDNTVNEEEKQRIINDINEKTSEEARKQYLEANIKGNKVVRLDLNGNYIDEYDSATKAEAALNMNRRFIMKCCRGEKDSFKGFKWVFKEDYKK